MRTVKVQDFTANELSQMSIEELRKAQHKNEMAQRELEADRKQIVAVIAQKEKRT
jgi:hypothetical protein